ncbi:hypothetical protein NCER_102574 [Vairimorpha ceranae BRL01]|uniref:Uncharacterized protein n=1 Tax=Vairimorpha ceranae (strain BRL01) TaxID=578460 RepID=C4VC75_VAIC1|nr:hypothetical protein NCER_102574 [Vairimorpha ceranae BRL01]
MLLSLSSSSLNSFLFVTDETLFTVVTELLFVLLILFSLSLIIEDAKISLLRSLFSKYDLLGKLFRIVLEINILLFSNFSLLLTASLNLLSLSSYCVNLLLFSRFFDMLNSLSKSSFVKTSLHLLLSFDCLV